MKVSDWAILCNTRTDRAAVSKSHQCPAADATPNLACSTFLNYTCIN